MRRDLHATGRDSAGDQSAPGAHKGDAAPWSDNRRKAPEVEGEEEPIFDDDNPEWTEEDFARAKRIHDLPELAFLLKRGRPRMPDEARKRRVSIMLDPDVIDHFKAGGKGWQTRLNAVLRKAAGL